MYTYFLTAGIATILIVVVLNHVKATGRIQKSGFEATLFILGGIWLGSSWYFPRVENGGAVIEVFWLGGLLVLYAGAHWLYRRFQLLSRQS